MPKSISTSNIKLKPVDPKNLNDSVKQNFSIYKSTKTLYQNDLTNQHPSIEGSQVPTAADDYTLSPPSRNGNKKKSVKQKLQLTIGKFPDSVQNDSLLRVDTIENSNIPGTTINKKFKINRLVESYATKYSGKPNAPAADANSSKETIRTGEPQQPSPNPKGYGSTELYHLTLPVDSRYILKHYESRLSSLEFREILDYHEIYYISDMNHKLPAKNDQDYDDDKGDYVVIRGDQVKYRYEVLDLLGRGSFGQVLKVLDHKTKEIMALKIIKSHKKFHFQAKIEIKILKYIDDNKGSDYHIIEMRDQFTFRNHVCLIFDLMSNNLYDFLKANKFRGFSIDALRKIAIQVLYSLKFLRDHKIIHCDLKPENILLKSSNKTGVKLIDFGSSCFEHEKLYTYIQSRFYRSPEIIMGLPYSTQIDMWSFGCLLCELSSGYPLFSGETELDQFLSIMEVMGPPDREMILKSPKKKKFFDEDSNPKLVQNSRGKVRIPSSISIQAALKCTDLKLLDLIKKCLVYDPDTRFNPDQALAHEWIIEGLPPQLQKKLPQTEHNRAESQRIQVQTIDEDPKILAHKRAFTKNSIEITKTEDRPYDSQPTYSKSKINLNINNPPEESVINITINVNENHKSPRKPVDKVHVTEEDEPQNPNSNSNSQIHNSSAKRRRFMTMNMNKYPVIKGTNDTSTEANSVYNIKNAPTKPVTKNISSSLEKKIPSFRTINTPKEGGYIIRTMKRDDSLDPKKFYFPSLKSPKGL